MIMMIVIKCTYTDEKLTLVLGQTKGVFKGGGGVYTHFQIFWGKVKRGRKGVKRGRKKKRTQMKRDGGGVIQLNC